MTTFEYYQLVHDLEESLIEGGFDEGEREDGDSPDDPVPCIVAWWSDGEDSRYSE